MGSLAKKCVWAAVVTATLAPLVGACADLEVRSVFMALDGTGNRRRTYFFTDTQAIYCDAEFASTRKDITINAVIRQIKDASGATVNTVIGVGELAPGVTRGIASFQLARPMPPPNTMMAVSMLPYPVGVFQCEMYVDALDPKSGAHSASNLKLQGLATFEIRYPECPVSFAANGAACTGFFKDNQVCPGANKATVCTCDPALGGWSCK
jgi:hypothetical protein